MSFCTNFGGKRSLVIGINADDWMVVSVSALYGVRAATYAEKSCLGNTQGLVF